MSKKLNNLASWFERQKRVLPWRDDPTLYRVWISEIMLQQTQVVTVVPYFERFLARFPTVESLAEAPTEDVLMMWAGLGYYSRARNLHRAAQAIVAAGGFPRDRAGWLEMPGVGEYTAGAILSIALGQPEAILDGNVERVLSRVYRVSRSEGDTVYKEALWKHSREWVEKGAKRGIRPSVLNQALMELGATICSPKKPKCLLCPLASECAAHEASEEESFPPKKKPKEWLKVEEEVHCVFDRDEDGVRMLLALRLPGEWRAGLWDFTSEKPGRKLSNVGKVESKLVVTRHKITRTAHIWCTKETDALLQAAEQPNLRWISVHQPEVAVGSALKKTLQRIRETYPEVLEAR